MWNLVCVWGGVWRFRKQELWAHFYFSAKSFSVHVQSMSPQTKNKHKSKEVTPVLTIALFKFNFKFRVQSHAPFVWFWFWWGHAHLSVCSSIEMLNTWTSSLFKTLLFLLLWTVSYTVPKSPKARIFFLSFINFFLYSLGILF